jgi:CRP/FNR family cyclic AMP-dependent transcriptional regulator
VKFDPSAFVADQDLLEALEKQSVAIVCPDERILFNQGDATTGLFILRAGEAIVTMNAPGGEQIMRTPVPAGSLLGLPGLIGNQPYSLTAVASKGAELGFIAREDFAEVMLNNPALSLKLLRVLAAEVRSARLAMAC